MLRFVRLVRKKDRKPSIAREKPSHAHPIPNKAHITAPKEPKSRAKETRPHSDPTTKGTTTVFMWKLVMVAAGVVLMIALKRKLYGPTIDEGTASAGVRTLAATSLILWIAAIAAGRWMAYV